MKPYVTPDSSKYWLGALRRRGWIVLLLAVIGLAIGFGVSKLSTKKYTALAALLFQQNGLSEQLFGYSTSAPINVNTADSTSLELVTEPVVADATGKALKISPGLVAGMISAGLAGSTDIVNITATSPSPQLAQLVANEYARQFIVYRRSSQQQQIAQAVTQLRAQVVALKRASAPASQIHNLQSRLSELQVLQSVQTGDVQLAQTAGLPSVPSSPRTKREAGLGLVVGLLFGLIAAALLERIDQRIRDADEVKSIVDLPVLGSIPRSRLFTRNGPVARADLDSSSEIESFRLLRSQLRYFNVDQTVRSVLVTSAEPGDGKSTVAWHLAREAARAAPERSVLLVDLDLRRPTVATTAELPTSQGLEDLLTTDLQVDDVVQHVQVSSGDDTSVLDVIPANGAAPNPSALMESRKLEGLLEQLQERYSLVILDSPPTSLISDAIPLLGQVSGVLVVVRVLKTSRPALRRLMEQLSQARATTLGVVVNDLRAQGLRGYDGYYGEYARLARRTPAAEEAPGSDADADAG